MGALMILLKLIMFALLIIFAPAIYEMFPLLVWGGGIILLIMVPLVLTGYRRPPLDSTGDQRVGGAPEHKSFRLTL